MASRVYLANSGANPLYNAAGHRLYLKDLLERNADLRQASAAQSLTANPRSYKR